MSNKTVETDLSIGVLHNTEWIHRWEVGNTKFHQPVYNKLLDTFEEKIFQGKKKSVLLPFCGKTLDLIWFYEHGHMVCGVELAEQPVREFFEEHKLEFDVCQVENVGKLYKSKDERMQLYVADLFDINVDVCGQYDVIYDCRSLTALNKADRIQYVNLMLSLMKKDGVYILYGREYDPAVWQGPPHTLSEKEVGDLYGDTCQIEKIFEADETSRDQTTPSASNSSDEQKQINLASGAGPALKTSSFIYARWFFMTFK